MGWEYLGLLFLVCLVLGLVGFYKYAYFISAGYGFSMVGIGISLTMLCLMKQFRAEKPHYIIFALLIIYGFRLTWFLMAQGKNATAYKTMQKMIANEKKISILTKVVTWIGVSAFCVLQTAPLFFNVNNGGFASNWTVAGIVFCVLGLVVETIADLQKGAQEKDSDKVVMKGLYYVVRHLKSFGEIFFWTGILVSSLGELNGFGQWAIALIGYICIVLVRFYHLKK